MALAGERSTRQTPSSMKVHVKCTHQESASFLLKKKRNQHGSDPDQTRIEFNEHVSKNK